jgi:diacylglycerol kinase (ATP)
MHAAAILGPGSSFRDLEVFQDQKNVDWQIGMPESPGDADAVLLFGGDGTVHRHLDQLVRLGLPLLVVPKGSGNDFARALGLLKVRDSVAAWQQFRASHDNLRTIDLGIIQPLDTAKAESASHEGAPNSKLETHHFCCVAGVGLDAEVARRANLQPRWLRRHGGYVLSLIPTILRFAPFPMKILTPADDPSPNSPENWIIRSDQPTILAAVANTPTYGGGMKIAPQAQLDDGLLDVCTVGGLDPFKLFCIFPTVYSGRHLKISEVGYSQFLAVRIETEHPFDLYADGEYVCRTPVEIRTHPAALPVIVPR